MPNKAIWYSATLAFNDEAMLAFSYWKVENSYSNSFQLNNSIIVINTKQNNKNHLYF